MQNLNEISGHEFLMKLKEQNNKKAVNYDRLFNLLDQKARGKGIPLVGQFELTPLCNFDCKMCYSHLTKKQMHNEPLLTVDQWKQIAEEACAAGLMRVHLTGGECLTYPDFKELYLFLHGLGIELSVLTNSTLLNDNWISFFTDHPPLKIQISLYGGDEESYEKVTGHKMFSVVCSNIRKLIEAKLPVSLAITPSKYMGKGILETIRTACSFGVPYSIMPFLIDPKEETGRSGLNHDLDLELFMEAWKLKFQLEGKDIQSCDANLLPPPGGPHHECDLCGLACGGGMSYFDIDWNGALYICNANRSVIGYPLSEGFLPAWKKIHEVAANWPRVPECIECPYEPLCTKCEIRKAKFGKSGTDNPMYQCNQTKYLIQHGVCLDQNRH